MREAGGNRDFRRGKRGLSPYTRRLQRPLKSITAPAAKYCMGRCKVPKTSAPAEKYYSARCKVLHGALQSVTPNAENLFFFFSVSELPYYWHVTLLLLDDAKVQNKN